VVEEHPRDHVLQPAERPQRGEGFPARAEHLRGRQPQGGFRYRCQVLTGNKGQPPAPSLHLHRGARTPSCAPE
jgi:hypothetical protein